MDSINASEGRYKIGIALLIIAVVVGAYFFFTNDEVPATDTTLAGEESVVLDTDTTTSDSTSTSVPTPKTVTPSLPETGFAPRQ